MHCMTVSFLRMQDRVLVLLVSRFADPYRIAPRHQRGARRAADGLSVEAGELQSLTGHPIEIGSSNKWRAKTADVVVSLVVREEDDEVGLPAR